MVHWKLSDGMGLERRGAGHSCNDCGDIKQTRYPEPWVGSDYTRDRKTAQVCIKESTVPAHTNQYRELELERKEATVFYKVFKDDQEDSFCKLLQAHGKYQLGEPRTDWDSGGIHWAQRWKPVGSLSHHFRTLISLSTYCRQENINFT